jgi:hypothetical protein
MAVGALTNFLLKFIVFTDRSFFHLDKVFDLDLGSGVVLEEFIFGYDVAFDALNWLVLGL